MDSLKKYNFKDDHGHPLENCQDFIELVHRAESAESDLAAMRQRAEAAGKEVIEWKGLSAERAFQNEGMEEERDIAVARAERAENAAVLVCNIVDRLRREFEIQRNVNFNGAYVVQRFVYAKKELVAALAAAPDKPQYAAMEPEPWGGPEGDDK